MATSQASMVNAFTAALKQKLAEVVYPWQLHRVEAFRMWDARATRVTIEILDPNVTRGTVTPYRIEHSIDDIMFEQASDLKMVAEDICARTRDELARMPKPEITTPVPVPQGPPRPFRAPGRARAIPPGAEKDMTWDMVTSAPLAVAPPISQAQWPSLAATADRRELKRAAELVGMPEPEKPADASFQIDLEPEAEGEQQAATDADLFDHLEVGDENT